MGTLLGVLATALASASVTALALPAVTGAHFVRARYAFKGDACTKSQRSDPVTMVVYGKRATWRRTDSAIVDATGWTWQTGGDQWLKSHHRCYHFDSQRAEHVTLSRFHVRLWHMPGRDRKGRRDVYLTPHHEDFVVGNGCGFPGNHAVDQNGPQGSGFDQGRLRLSEALVDAGYVFTDVQYWGNTRTFKQCDGGRAGSNGSVYWIKLHKRG